MMKSALTTHLIPDASFKAGVRRFPVLVPTDANMRVVELSCQARTWFQQAWLGEAFVAVGMRDPVLGMPVMAQLRDTIAL